MRSALKKWHKVPLSSLPSMVERWMSLRFLRSGLWRAWRELLKKWLNEWYFTWIDSFSTHLFFLWSMSKINISWVLLLGSKNRKYWVVARTHRKSWSDRHESVSPRKVRFHPVFSDDLLDGQPWTNVIWVILKVQCPGPGLWLSYFLRLSLSSPSVWILKLFCFGCLLDF